MVRFGFIVAWRLAGSPTRRSPLSVNATTLGVSRLPSWLAMTLTSPPSMTATTELVVPRSMPMIFSSAMFRAPSRGNGPLVVVFVVPLSNCCAVMERFEEDASNRRQLDSWVKQKDSRPRYQWLFQPFWQSAKELWQSDFPSILMSPARAVRCAQMTMSFSLASNY